jgi:hypothetical protein
VLGARPGRDPAPLARHGLRAGVLPEGARRPRRRGPRGRPPVSPPASWCSSPSSTAVRRCPEAGARGGAGSVARPPRCGRAGAERGPLRDQDGDEGRQRQREESHMTSRPRRSIGAAAAGRGPRRPTGRPGQEGAGPRAAGRWRARRAPRRASGGGPRPRSRAAGRRGRRRRSGWRAGPPGPPPRGARARAVRSGGSCRGVAARCGNCQVKAAVPVA